MKRKRILLAHGEGGRLTRDLVEEIFLRSFKNRYLDRLDDGALLTEKDVKVVFTTDSYVVKPIFFPGGDIGRLSVYGTCNDLAVMGAVPKYISCAFIIEEGFDIETLEKVVTSMSKACKRSGVKLVTGDTKVVEKGNADGLYINTTGIGFMMKDFSVSPTRVSPGDLVLISGTIGDHGIAVLMAREQLGIKSSVRSDAAPLYLLTKKLGTFGRSIKFMRDPTRGGLATALCELAKSSRYSIEVREESIPIREDVRSACDILGFDPLYIANEGKLLLVVSRKIAGKVIDVMRLHSLGRKADVIGEIKSAPTGKVVLHTLAGGRRLVDMLSGEQLPRIC
jgi:hydrogenase expression/formation protein HypE